MLLNNYKVYGLNIKSEIKIDEFENLNAIPEDEIVTISYSVMDDEIKKSVSEGRKIQLQKEKIWFHIDNIATYCIKNGNKVEVEVCENANMQLMKIYIMCSCLGFIMLQRDMVAIHGGVFDMVNNAVIFTGDRGAG